jgi:hypothetical protein
VREHGVAGDDLALDRQHSQELQRGLVFVGLGINSELADDRLDVRGIGGHQVNPGPLTVATSSDGLAVDGDVRGLVQSEPPLDPLGDARLKVRDVDPAEDPGVGRLAKAAFPGEAKEIKERSTSFATVLDDAFVTGHAREHGNDSQRKEGGKGMSLTLGTARILNAYKQFHQRIGFHA